MKIALLFFSSFFISFTFTLQAQNRLKIQIPTPEAEAQYIWRNIQDIKFFDQYGYNLSLPKGPFIDSLLNRSRTNRLSDSDFENLQSFVASKVYQKEDYYKAKEAIELQKDFLNSLVNQLTDTEWNWPFKSYKKYQINLTLYGPGGSYNPSEGSILLYATTEGKFKMYDEPANTIIHEIVHIGIEDAIIGKYQVPHALKERIVDTFVKLFFKDELEGYRLQNMGDPKLDEHLESKEELLKLDKVVEAFMEKK